MTSDEYRVHIAKLQEMSEQQKRKLATFEGRPQITQKDFEKVSKSIVKAWTAYSDRRERVRDLIGNISEGMDKPPREIKEMVGVDEGRELKEVRALF